MKRKFKVEKNPRVSPGPNSNQFPYYFTGGEWQTPDVDVRSTLQPVDPEDATMEAEANETVFVPDVQGLPAHFKVGGKRHSEGGTPLDVPDNSFVFSDTRDMRIGGSILKHFGKSEDTKKKYTPADLAKKYDINKFRKTLADPDADQLYTVPTAEMMIANYNKKLGQLSLVQESIKGFPSGIPQVAMPYLITAAVEPDQVLPLKGTPGQEMMQPGSSNGQMRHGGNAFQNSPTGGGFWQTGGQVPEEENWYDTPLQVAGHVLNAVPNSMSYLSQYLPYTMTGFDPQYKPRYESLGDNFNRMQTMQGTDPWTGDTLTPGKPLTPKEKLLFDIGADPQSVIGVSGAVKTVGKGALNTAFKVGDAASYVKGLSQKALLNLMDIFKTKDIKTLIKYIAKNADQVAGRVAPALSKFQDKPQPTGGYNLPVVDITADRIQKPDATQVAPFIPQQVPLMTNQPDTIDAFRQLMMKRMGGSLEKYQDGKQYKAGNKYKGKTIQISGVNKSGNTVIQFTDGTVAEIPKSKTVAKPQGRYKQFSKDWFQTVTGMGYDPGISEDMYTDQPLPGNVPVIQSNRGDRVYGEKDWWGDSKLQESWKKRHQWFTKEHPDFDPRKKGATELFQSEHNKYLKKKGLPEYFNTDWSKAHAVDDDFGGVTWAAPDPTKITKPEQVAAVATKTKDLYPNTANYNQADPNAPWWLQDVVRTAGAAGDFLRIKKYLPWAPKMSPYLPETTFYDPTRELASNAEQMQIGTQGVGVFAGPQAYNSRFSQIQGQGAKNAADILGKYNNMNVQTSNVAGAQRADIMNKTNEFNAKTALDLYDKTTIANQQFDNSKNQARQELRQSYMDAITNRAQAQTLNSMYENYQFDPSTGGLTTFYKGDNMIPGSSGSSILSTLREYENAGYTRDQAIDILNSQNKDEYNDARLNLAQQSGYGSRRRRSPYPQNPYTE